jgi:hypothetical protein
VQRRLVYLKILASLWLALGGCAAEYPSRLVDGPVALPNCADVGLFGNGAVCLDADGSPDLSLCDAESPACSVQDVCFDTAMVLACRCSTDVDCTGWGDHVNAALSSEGLSVVPVGCAFGHCAAISD